MTSPTPRIFSQRGLIALTRPSRYWLDSLLYRMFADTTALSAMRDRFAAKTVLVVGNGPSLNETPLDEFAGVPSIGMNKIDLIYPRTIWRPSAVVCLNNVVAQQHQDHFADSPIPSFVAWKARWLMSPRNRKRISYFNTHSSGNFSTCATTGFGSSATVTYIALQMAYWMGARTVILLGVDHSFKFAGSAATYQKREGPDLNHFDPNYFKAGSVWGTPDLDRSERDYIAARQAFEADGREILDATVGGQLQVFKKLPIIRAIEVARQ